MRIWQYKDLGQVPASDFLAMVREVNYQRRVEQYPLLQIMAQVVCVLVNSKTSKHRPHEFIGDEPKREVQKRMVKKDNYEILLGDGEVYTLSVLNANMMEAVEDEFDKSWAELFGPTTRIKVIKSMLLQMLKPNYPDMDMERVGKLMTTKTMPALVAIITNMSK